MRPDLWNGIPVPYGASIDELVNTARGPEPERWAAFVALSHTPDALPVLADLSRSPDCFVRRAAVEAVGNHSQGHAASPAVIERLKDRNAFVVRAACEAAANLQIFEAHDGVLQLLSDPAAATREAAVRALRSIWCDADLEPVLRIFVEDVSDEVRKESAWTLRAGATSSNWHQIFSIWRTDPQPRHRAWACELAAAFGSARENSALLVLSRDLDGHVRNSAQSALDSIQGRH